MLLQGPGRFQIQCVEPGSFFYASVSAHDPVRVEVWQRGILVDEVFVANGASHTWWVNNPIFSAPFEMNEVAEITIYGQGTLRFEAEGSWGIKSKEEVT